MQGPVGNPGLKGGFEVGSGVGDGVGADVGQDFGKMMKERAVVGRIERDEDGVQCRDW